ncbi:MAG: cyclase family protein [Thermoplasmata archaeon]
MARPIDISMPLAVGMAAFPGDPLFAGEPVRSLARGDGYNVSRISLGTHAGTHVDPPVHFLEGGDPIDRVDLRRLNGPCRVLRIPDGVERIGPAHLASVPRGTRRLLLRTRNSRRWEESPSFFPDYTALSPEGAQALLARGVDLIGIDSLSIERDPSGTFPVHHAVLGGGALILEGLRLAAAPPGRYELRCLPLRIADGDGGPARAVLLRPGRTR